jgi:phosphate transport system substrate-binding protein
MGLRANCRFYREGEAGVRPEEPWCERYIIVKLKRVIPAAAIVSIGALTLSACGGSATGETGTGSQASDSASVSGTLVGIGSSAQKSAVQAWSTDFKSANSGAQVNYSPDGSGAGVKQFLAGTADFAGSDAYLEDDQVEAAKKVCGPDGAIEFPVYISPISVAFNLEGVSELNMSPSLIAQIFSGKITTWNDPAIKAENADANLPDSPITAVHRKDESGTTENFTDYLNKTASKDWPDEGSKEFPGAYKGESAQGTDGVVSTVTKTKGAIGYVDSSAVTDDMGTAKIKVGDTYVAHSAEAAAKAVEASDQVSGRGENDIAIDIKRDSTEADTYPLVLVSYHIVCSAYADQAKADLVKSWEKYVLSDEGQQSGAENAKSAPLSPAVAEKAAKAVDTIKVKG